MNILGISAFYHDSAAALLIDGDIMAAAQEERFTRAKNTPAFPRAAIRYCLNAGGVTLSEVDHVVFYDKPILKFERLMETYLATAPTGFPSFRLSMPTWIKDKLLTKKGIERELKTIAGSKPRSLLFAEHHQSHAASAYYPSPFDSAAILTMDGVGEWATTSTWHGQGAAISKINSISWPHSLGLLYTAFTYFAGFKVNSGEYKLMGLAPYGQPKYRDLIMRELIDVKPDGSFRLNQRYFTYATGLRMVNKRFEDLFGWPARHPEEPLEERHMDLAASVQAVTEEVVLRVTRWLARTTGARKLCLAGGVALNCVANGKVAVDDAFDEIWVQPAPGDAGGAVGAALVAHYDHVENRTPKRNGMHGAFLGPEYHQAEIEQTLSAARAQFHTLDESAVLSRASADLADGKIVGWFQGRMEFGPRALGARSILADPRNAEMQARLNLSTKYRESFRPFAPAVLAEEQAAWFGVDVPSPFMSFVVPVSSFRQRSATATGLDRLKAVDSAVPAVTHVDGTARVQTVAADQNPRFHALLTAFHAQTACPVLVNTSFNIRGEPIVCTPLEAFECFMKTDMDSLVIGDCYLSKAEQNPALRTRAVVSAFVD